MFNSENFFELKRRENPPPSHTHHTHTHVAYNNLHQINGWHKSDEKIMRKRISQSFSTYLSATTNGFVLLCTVARQQFTTPYKIDKPIYKHTHTFKYICYVRMYLYIKWKRHTSQDEKNAQLYCTQTLAYTYFPILFLPFFFSRNKQCTCFCLVVLQLPS